jgi:hypothetical protein
MIPVASQGKDTRMGFGFPATGGGWGRGGYRRVEAFRYRPDSARVSGTSA